MGRLEHFLEQLIWYLADLPFHNEAVGPILTQRMATSSKVRTIEILAQQFASGDTEYMARIKAFSRAVDTIFNRRNYLLHSAWLPPIDPSELPRPEVLRHRSKAKTGLVWTSEKLEPDEIDSLTATSEELVKECIDLTLLAIGIHRMEPD